MPKTHVSPGGLPPGLSPAKFGIKSVHRNPLIADIFSRAGKVERAGTGIRRIRGLLAQAGCADPEFVFNGFVDLIFPRRPRTADTAADWIQVRYPVSPQSVPSQRQVEVLKVCLTAKSFGEIFTMFAAKFQKTNRARFRNGIIKPLLEAKLLAPTIPDKLQSRLQKYVTTAEGRKWLEAAPS
jgi:ATP-dependent DNA helicase RecG